MIDLMFDKTFLKDTAERSLSTAAATLVALVGSDGAGMLDIAVLDSLKAAAAAGLLAFIKSVAARRAPFGDTTASLVDLSK